MADQEQKTTRESFIGAVLSHDWTACFSDDFSVSRRSEAHYAANIKPFVDQFPKEWLDLRWPGDENYTAWRERQKTYVAEIGWKGLVR